jgi:hypothetical protein
VSGHGRWLSRADAAKSDLIVARLKAGMFVIDPGAISMNVYTDGLEYPPAISSAGRELFSTRASRSGVRIIVATRTSADAPFDEPPALRALTGFMEAPTSSLDGKEMSFHKNVGEKFPIYWAERRSS